MKMNTYMALVSLITLLLQSVGSAGTAQFVYNNLDVDFQQAKNGKFLIIWILAF